MVLRFFSQDIDLRVCLYRTAPNSIDIINIDRIGAVNVSYILNQS